MPLQVTGSFANGSKVDVTHSLHVRYSSQNPQIATVDDQGIVTAVALGKTYIGVCNTTDSRSCYFVNTTVGTPQRQ